MISGIGWVSELIEIAGGIEVFPRTRRAQERQGTHRHGGRRDRRARPTSSSARGAARNSCPRRSPPGPALRPIPAVRNGWLREIKSTLILQPGPAALTDGLDAMVAIFDRWAETVAQDIAARRLKLSFPVRERVGLRGIGLSICVAPSRIHGVIPGRELKQASPESITTAGSMDSGPAPSGASRNDGRWFEPRVNPTAKHSRALPTPVRLQDSRARRSAPARRTRRSASARRDGGSPDRAASALGENRTARLDPQAAAADP